MPGRFFLLISILLFAFDQPRLVKTRVADDIIVSVPADWRPMDDLDFTDRYPSVRAPVAAFTNEERTVDFSVNISATQWAEGDHALAQSFFKASLRNMFDRLDISGEGIRDIRGKKYIFFEFESRVNGSGDGEVPQSPIVRYTYLQYLIAPGRTLVFAFNSPARERGAWQDVADAMMKSVRVK